MTGERRLKLDILRYVYEAHTLSVDMREFSCTYGYDEDDVATAVDELYPLLECSISPLEAWIGYEQAPTIKTLLESDND